MKPLIVANWKSNPASLEHAVALAREIDRKVAHFRKVETVIAPPFPFLLSVGRVLRKSKLGAQNTFWGGTGPYTGEVSWQQLKYLGVTYVIVGHSERKFHLGETDEMINKKIRALLVNNLKAILCVGEQERGGREIPAVVGQQIKSAIRRVRKNQLRDLIIAYEPVWAISTNPGAMADTPDSVFRAMVYIRKTLTKLYDRKAADMVRIIYGGSVSAQNIGPFLQEGKMEGALVGGASLRPRDFANIAEIASRII